MKNTLCRYLSTLSLSSFFLLALVLSGFYSVNSSAADTYPGGVLWANGYAQGATQSTVFLGTQTNACGTIASGGPGCSVEGASIYAFHTVQTYCNAAPTVNSCAYATGGVNQICSVTCMRGAPYNSVSTSNVTVYPTTIAPTPPNPCPAKAGTSAIPSGKIAYGENAEGTSPSTASMCDADLCVIKINHASTVPIGDGKQAVFISNGTFTGVQAASSGSCPLTIIADSPSSPELPKPIDTITPAADTASGIPDSPADCPPGSAFGSVNGVNVCSPAGSEISYVPSTSTQTDNGATTESKIEWSDKVNEDGSVTRTTKNSATGPNGETTNSTTTNTGAGNTRFGVDGGTGDKQQPITLGPAPLAESGEVADPFPAPGTGVDGSGGTEKEFGVTTHFTAAGACLADKSVTTPLGTWTIPLSALCPWFDIMYKIISLVAVFVALRILVMA